MSKASSIQITQSNIIALWQLISITRRYSDITVKSAIETIRESGLAAGELPADQGLKLGQHCRLLEISEQRLFATQFCKDNLFNICDAEEPNIDVFRGVLLRYVSFQNLDWLLFFNDDADIFRTAIPDDWIELLDGASLFEFDSVEVRDWWGQVFSKFQTYKEGQKVEIGKVAEKLTFEFERKRLETDGLENGPQFVKWASQITDKYGYDILSIRGNMLKLHLAERSKIQVEVKCSVSSNEQEFRFYVTNNEWNTALKQLDSYYFYCWTSTSKEKETAHGPFIIPASDLSDHIPINNGSLCQWSECRFVIDIDQFRIN